MPTTTRSMGKANAASAEEAPAGAKHKMQSGSAPAPKARKKEEGELEDHKPKAGNAAATKGGNQHTRASRASHKKGAEGAVEPGGRDGDVPSTILEKGVIYFFVRGRVNVEDPQDVDEVARSFFILRPIERDAALGSGALGLGDGAANSRLCVVPKKVLPRSGRDRWIAWVEKAGVDFETLRRTFLEGGDYETKTAGPRHRPGATPVGEGVYAITSTGRENHLAYLLSVPAELGELQTELGLKERGSFIISTRNPKYPPPKYAQLPEAPEYPKKIRDEFRNLRWVGTRPEHLDVAGTQFLLIGESSGLDKAMRPDEEDQKAGGTEEPMEEMEKLEHEDTQRMKHLGEDHAAAIFADLEALARDQKGK